MSFFPALLLLAPLQERAALLRTPPGWRHERLAFPLSFAPELELRGFEDLGFAPGMFAPDSDSDSYFSYALALRLEGEVEVDEEFLDDFLETYYRGLCRAVAAERKIELDLRSISATVRRDGGRFFASVALFDPFVTGEPLELALELESRPAPRATELLGLASPLDPDAPIWKELRTIGQRWREDRPVPVLLNHVYVVPDRETYDALERSEFLRQSFAVFEQRETVRADASYSGLYLYGWRTYLEFLPPGAAGLAVGSSGLALGIEVEGGTDELARKLDARSVKTHAVPITRQLEDAQVPWFRLLGVEMPPSRLSVFSLEYDPRFLASWHGELAPARGGIARAAVLERYAAALERSRQREEAPFADVTAVQLALGEAELERLLEVCRACGHEIEAGAGQWTCHGPQFRLVLRSSGDSRGVTGIELSLRRPLEHEPLQLGKAVLSFHGRTAEFVFQP